MHPSLWRARRRFRGNINGNINGNIQMTSTMADNALSACIVPDGHLATRRAVAIYWPNPGSRWWILRVVTHGIQLKPRQRRPARRPSVKNAIHAENNVRIPFCSQVELKPLRETAVAVPAPKISEKRKVEDADANKDLKKVSSRPHRVHPNLLCFRSTRLDRNC